MRDRDDRERQQVSTWLPRFALGLLAAVATVACTGAREPDGQATLVIEPSRTVLDGARSEARVIATARSADGTTRDASAEVFWTSASPEVVAVGPGGWLTPKGDGTAEVVARIGSLEARTVVEVRNTGTKRPVWFRYEVLPALTRSGCNQGACHGTPSGKNGFRLSLRGFDPALDFATLAREGGGRRTNPVEPDSSLILLKGTGAVPHEGGRRFGHGDVPYRVLRDWIAEGLRPDPEGVPVPTALDVFPADRVLDDPASEQALVVRARFKDGTVRDVTRLTRFGSSDEAVARVEGDGLVRRERPGEVTILVGFGDLVATSHLIFRAVPSGLAWVDPPENNVIDQHVFAKLKLLGIPPADLTDDATFCRRVHLDVLGLPPTPEAVRAFLANDRPDKRTKLIETLLDRPEYVDFWTLKWADRLGCNQRFTGLKGAYSYHRWIRDQVAANTPLDQFARSIVTAKGANYTDPPASFYRRLRSPEDAVETVSQLFLGVRIQCARCHNHVAERWTQDDYYGMAAFFAKVRFKDGPQRYAQYNKEETVYLDPSGRLVQPRTGAVAVPKPLGGPPADISTGADPREALADWMLAPTNPFFARAAANRIWYHLMGRGIVEPVDDLRDSNPPSCAPLLEALAEELASHDYDTEHLIRLILNSRTYQLTSRPAERDSTDGRYFSRARVRLLSAEQLLDAASLATGAPEALFHLPPGTRAAQVPDGEFDHPFLRAFGQPPRSGACECERGTDSTLAQALQVVGGRTIHALLVAPDNRIGRLLKASASDDAIVDDLFLAALGRPPTPAERSTAIARLPVDPAPRRRVVEDLLWALLNHPEFLFQH